VAEAEPEGRWADLARANLQTAADMAKIFRVPVGAPS
jgi:hypothetical protein